MKLVAKKYPQYLVFHEMLGINLVGIKTQDILEVHEPQKRLMELLKQGPTDELLAAMERTLKIATANSDLSTTDFGVFGFHASRFPSSKIFRHRLYHLRKSQNAKMRQTLKELTLTPVRVKQRVCLRTRHGWETVAFHQ
jgi:hypothetical protein